MDKIVSQLLWFNRLCVTTANAGTLIRLAELIEQGNYSGFRELIGELDGRLKIRTGTHASVRDDLTIVLPEPLYPVLATRLRILATGEQHTSFFLNELVRDLANHSRNNWEIRQVEHHPEPERDYAPEPDGTEWEAVLLHDAANPEVLEAAWQEIVRWSVPSNQEDPRKLFVSFNGAEPVSESYDPQEAFEVFLSGRAPIQGSGYLQSPIQVVGFGRVPLRNWYGEALDRIQVWFEKTRVVLIVADRHAETGCIEWDLENFFAYYSLVKAVSSRVSANRFAWWICADNAEEAAALTIDKLDDLETLWGIFSSLTVARRVLDRARFDVLFSSRPADG